MDVTVPRTVKMVSCTVTDFRSESENELFFLAFFTLKKEKSKGCVCVCLCVCGGGLGE